jgi:hypothetical protein
MVARWARPFLVDPQHNQSVARGQAGSEESCLSLAPAHDLKSTFRTDAEAVGDRAQTLCPSPRHTCVYIG